MGWTSYHANNYKNGKIDIKKECEANISDSFKVLKSSIVGSTYYAAIEDIENGEIFAAVILTSVNNSDYYNFSYKSLTEFSGPCKYDCPAGILKMLSPTDNEWANSWRDSCYKKKNIKKELNTLPVGTTIKVNDFTDPVTKTKIPHYSKGFVYKWINKYRQYIPESRIVIHGYAVC